MSGDITEHFSRYEFKCPCGCGRDDIDKRLVERLENVFEYLTKCERGCKYIIITNGIRCPTYSTSVGGFATDAHTRSMAADWYCIGDDDKPYSDLELAAVCELFHFGGIGVHLFGDNERKCVHSDIRDLGGYTNNHWFGDEQTGDNYQTFAQYLPPAKIINKHKISLSFDGKKIFEKEV